MKTNLLILSVFIAFASVAQSTNTGFHIKSYDIKLKLDTTARKLEVENSILFNNLNSKTDSKVLFWKSIVVDSIRAAKHKIPFERKSDTLIFRSKSSGHLMLTFYYSLPIDSFMYDKAILLTRGMKWSPYLHDNISSLTSEVIVPKKYNVYSSGTLINSESRQNCCIYHFKNEINSGLPFVIVPTSYYNETSVFRNGVEMKYVFHNPDTILQREIINESLSAFNYCNTYIGKYHRKNLTYIEVPGFGSAQSFESLIIMSSDFVSYFKLYADMRTWVAHETIHQWIGTGYFNAIYDSSNYGVFIEESFTEYLRFLYIGNKFGSDSITRIVNRYKNIYNNEIKGTDQDVPISDNIPSRVAYCTGPLIFHEVNLQMGEQKFQEFVRMLYSKYYGQVIDYNIFRKTLGIYTAENVIEQMEQNANTKGIPKELPRHLQKL